MSERTRNPEEMLFEYLDGKLDPRQHSELERLLEADPSLRARLDDIARAHDLLTRTGLSHPSPNFTSQLMNKLEGNVAVRRLSIRNGLFLLAGILVVVFAGMALLSSGIFDQQSQLDLNSFNIVRQYLKLTLPTVAVDGEIVVNVIILVNLAIAFVVLDRAVLKPLFQRRLQASQKF